MPIQRVRKLPDLSRFDHVYDDIEENSSIINLWKKQKALELGADSSTATYVEDAVNAEHNIINDPEETAAKPPRTEQKEGVDINTEKDMNWSEELMIPYEQFKKLSKKTLIVKRTVQMTRKGKLPSMYALVVVGNGRGSAGYGEGKGFESSKAVLFATRNAIKNMKHFPRYDNRTIYHDIEQKYKATKLMLWARRPGFGCRVAPTIHEICECIGIQDLAGKIHGSRNPMNVIKTFFAALESQRLPNDLAKARGIRLVDINHTYYGEAKVAPLRN
ncbi:28S ribosomal protein S5, mitochondrial [Coemansia sp. RSA 2559]|nr:28S ribosomal protein S5, mitochondrial [Coemansia sp. RSA 2559]KAJ2845023.1 28S ribosomal protein S5, mitochondrial [Coemansia erecta]